MPFPTAPPRHWTSAPETACWLRTYAAESRGWWPWPPAQSYAEIRHHARAELSGVHRKLLPMFRYALIWRKPGGDRADYDGNGPAT